MAYCSVMVDCPATAREGERVQASVTVTNLHTYDWMFLTEIWANSELIREWPGPSVEDMIPSGTSKTYSGYFTMPSTNVTVLGWVDRVSSIEPYKVVFGCAGSKVVKLEVVPQYSLTVSQSPVVGEITVTPLKDSYAYGDRVALTSYVDVPYKGVYEFDYWMVNGQRYNTFSIEITIVGHTEAVAYQKLVEVELWREVERVTALSIGAVEVVTWNVVGQVFNLEIALGPLWLLVGEVSDLTVASGIRWVLVEAISDLTVASGIRWQLVGVVSDLAVALPGVPPPPPPPEEKEFPWGTALLVGGGAALLAAAAAKKGKE